MPYDPPPEADDAEPRDAEDHLERATDFFREGDLDAAEAELRASLEAGTTEFWRMERREDLAALLVTKARRLAAEAGDADEIARALREARELDPENADAVSELEKRGDGPPTPRPEPPAPEAVQPPPPPEPTADEPTSIPEPPSGPRRKPVATPPPEDETPPEFAARLQSFRENPRLTWTVVEDMYEASPNEPAVRALHELLRPLAQAQGLACRHG